MTQGTIGMVVEVVDVVVVLGGLVLVVVDGLVVVVEGRGLVVVVVEVSAVVDVTAVPFGSVSASNSG